MVPIKQCDENIDIEKCPHDQIPSSSISLWTCCKLMGSSRSGSISTPFLSLSPSESAGAKSLFSPALASSEITAPVVVFSAAAISFAACKTVESISNPEHRTFDVGGLTFSVECSPSPGPHNGYHRHTTHLRPLCKSSPASRCSPPRGIILPFPRDCEEPPGIRPSHTAQEFSTQPEYTTAATGDSRPPRVRVVHVFRGRLFSFNATKTQGLKQHGRLPQYNYRGSTRLIPGKRSKSRSLL